MKKNPKFEKGWNVTIGSGDQEIGDQLWTLPFPVE